MTTSRIPDVIDYLVATFQASPLLGAADPPVTIFDGPGLVADNPLQALWIGLDNPGEKKGAIGAEAEQEWVGLGARQRNEHITVFCSIGVWTGDETDDHSTSAVRTTAFSILATVEDIVRSDASLGRAVLFVDSGVTNVQYKPIQAVSGPMAQIDFKINGFARIGG